MNKKFVLTWSSLAVSLGLLFSPAVGLAQDSGQESASESFSAGADEGNLIAVVDTGVLPSEVTEATDFDTAMAVLSDYLILGADGQHYFDADRAEADGASEYLLAAGDAFNRFAAGQVGKSDPTLRLSMPGYGNWCGPGHSGPGAPVDTIDSLCQKHDQCYAARGYSACSCDRELLQGIRDNRGNFHGFGENAMALAIAAWFNSAPCNPFV